MKKLFLALAFMLVGAFFAAPPSHAVSLKVAPLEYRTTLDRGEKQKGFIDVSNPTTDTVRVKTSVQAFRQTDDNGSLQFFENEQLRAGVLLDLDEFELGPHEALRMYFLLDGARLPSGDVYGAIFFTTTPVDRPSGVGQAVRLGTLLSVVNGTPGPRQAEITGMTVPWLQLSDTIAGSYRIKNTANPDKATGFYPTVRLDASPFGSAQKQTGRLTFAGITRTNDFSLSVFPIGIYKVSVAYQDSAQSQWVVVASPLAILVVVGLLVGGTFLYRFYARFRQIHARSNDFSRDFSRRRK